MFPVSKKQTRAVENQWVVNIKTSLTLRVSSYSKVNKCEILIYYQKRDYCGCNLRMILHLAGDGLNC